jgi:CHAT domain-containing protein
MISRTTVVRCLTLVLVTGTWWSIASPYAQTATSSQEPAALAPGVTVDRAMAANDAHRFQLPMSQGQGIRVSVDQLGVDVDLELGMSPAATPAVQHDDSTKRHIGRELLVWLAPDSGTVQLTVRAKSVLPEGGRYHLTVALLEPSETLTSAVTTLDEGMRLSEDAARASGERAEQQLQQAVQGWTSLGDREMAAGALSQLSFVQLRRLGHLSDAITSQTQALAVYDDLGLATESSAALNRIGDCQFSLSQSQQAVETHQRAYALSSSIDPVNRAIIEDNIARDYLDIDFDQAISFGERAVETFRTAGAYYDEFISLERLALAYTRVQSATALERITKALALGRQYGKPGDVANLTMTLGRIQMSTGDDAAALATFKRASDLFIETQPNRFLVQLLQGRIYNRQGDVRTARELLERTLAAVPAQQRALWAGVATELGVSLAQDGDATRALDLQKQALDIVEPGQSRLGILTVLRNLAATYRALGDVAQANAMLDRAAALTGTTPHNPYAALLLRERARNARAAGDLQQARQQLDAALAIIDSERGRMQTLALRTAFGGTRAGFYAEAIDVEMALHGQSPQAGHDARAFELFERARARSLTDLLNDARVNPSADVDPDLLTERRTLQQQLGLKDNALRELGNSAAAKARGATLEQEIDDIARQLDLLDARIRTASPQYAALTSPPALTLQETQQLLDDDTVLLAFAVDRNASWGWAITRGSVRSFPLPEGRRIETQAQRVYAALTARQRHEGHLLQVDRQLNVDAAALGDLVLGPIASSLRGEWRHHRLAIIATGPLEYIPFGALPVPGAAAAAATGQPPWLVEQHEIVRLPSASVLSLLRGTTHANRDATTTLAVLADPVYTADDPRVRVRTPEGTLALRSATPPSRSVQPEADVTADALDSGFARLMFSRREAQAIAQLAPAHGVVQALDFSASVRTMQSPAVARARIVHVASHGILNSVRPELSGLVLSLVDERGRQQSGVFHLYDIFNLRLAADLVVLSGCETGLGRQMNGEGLIGLTRGFMHAGAPRVVASLWQVDDVATAELMRRFYAGMLQQKLTPAAALHAAQQQMATRAPWRSPYYWAAFTLVGDWR